MKVSKFKQQYAAGQNKADKRRKPRAAVAALCAVMLCVSVLCESASAAYLVVMDLADIVEQTAPSVVEVFTETKQVSQSFREYVIQGAGSGVVLTEDGYIPATLSSDE